MFRKLTIVATFVLCALMLVPAPSEACTGFRCWLYDAHGNLIVCGTCTIIREQQQPGQTLFAVGETTVTRLANGNVRVEVDGLESVGISEGDVCAAGLNSIPGIAKVESVKVVHSETGRTIDGFGFAPNAVTSEAYRAEAELVGSTDSRWSGFLGSANREVPQGTPIKYVFEVKLERGVTLNTFAASLREQGVFGAGSANSRGELTFGHVEITPLASRPILYSLAPRPGRETGGGSN
jgi:hypothetical protein